MTVYWETSSRPLFVKTVWTDGHRHPVLNKEDPLLHPALKPTKRRRRRKPPPESPTPWEHSEHSADEELNISTVRLLLAKQKQETKVQHPRREIRRMYSLDLITRDLLKSNSTKTLHPHPITTFKIPIRGEHRQATAREEKKELNDYNVLSERVMVWLDLASQNGETLKLDRYPNFKPKERISTCPCPKRTAKISETSEEMPDDENSGEEEQEQLLHIKSIGEDAGGCVDYKPTPRVLPSYRQDTKRQLHIFIPDLLRRGDSESTLTMSSL